MLKVATIIGARPQIIKASALSRVIKESFSDRIREVLVHTGQHYDDNMSGNFFDELGLDPPKYNLDIRGKNHAEQTGRMTEKLGELLELERPDMAIVYGDTNSTLAGALAAAKEGVPVVHIEAGLRSFNRTMPEEINRVLTDHISSLLFCPGENAVRNLEKEGRIHRDIKKHSINEPGIFISGDIMLDNLLYFSMGLPEDPSLFKTLDITAGNFALCTIHRDFNADNPERLESIIVGLLEIAYSNDLPVILPIHPRTRSRLFGSSKAFSALEKDDKNLLRIISPLGYTEILHLEKNARVVLTDSGGLQKEAYYFNRPVVVLRPESEWTELVENGFAILADADEIKIVDAFNELSRNTPGEFPPFYGTGHAAASICEHLMNEESLL
jgi:UDP-GlcNAc3NAcA epimerase